MLFAVAMALGKMDLLKAQDGHLTVPLDQWRTVSFTLKGKTIRVPVTEVFAALAEMSEPPTTKKTKQVWSWKPGLGWSIEEVDA